MPGDSYGSSGTALYGTVRRGDAGAASAPQCNTMHVENFDVKEATAVLCSSVLDSVLKDLKLSGQRPQDAHVICLLKIGLRKHSRSLLSPQVGVIFC